MNVLGVTSTTRVLCVLLVVFAVFGHVSESVPLWNTGPNSNSAAMEPTRMNPSLVYRWLIRLMSRKDLYSWINFHPHPILTASIGKTGPATPVAPLSDGELQIQRDTDDFGTVPIVRASDTGNSGSGNDGDATSAGPALIVVRDVEDTTTSHPVTLLSTASIVNQGIPMIILSGDKNVDRIGDNSQTPTADDSSTPQMVRDTFDDMPVAGATMGPAGEGDDLDTPSVPVIVNPSGSSAAGDSNSNSDSTNNPDSSLTIVRDKDGESGTATSDNDTPASSSSTSQSTSSSSGSTSSGLLILNPADLLGHGFPSGK